MTLGEHLDELRGCVIRALFALLIGCLICIWPAKYLLMFIARPVVLVLRRQGQPYSLLATSPVENILVYVKVVLIFGLLLSAPYVIYQLWKFAASGLHEHEKRWVYRLVPASVGLFITGVVFMYLFVLLVSLNFLVGFSGWLPLPEPRAQGWEKLLLREHDEPIPETQPALDQLPPVPIFAEDPEQPPAGSMWLNLTERKLKVRGSEGTYSVQVLRDEQRGLVTTHFKIGEYLSFFLVMTIAFGVAFQMPLVVMFLTWTGIVPTTTLREYRRVVILLIVVCAGILAPPDLFSHLLLSGPMIVLFEIGLLLSRRNDRARAARVAD